MITMDIRKRHIVRTLRAAVLLLFVSAFLSRCASMMTPTGGPRDSLPPVIVNMTPDNFSTNRPLVNHEKIYIEFDEFVQLKDQQKEFFTSPQMKKKPLVSLRGRGVVIQLRDTLEANTTYSLNFGSAIRDNNEGNPLYSMRYVFSTGPEIDSMVMSGYTADSYKADSVSKSFIWFFPADSVEQVAGYDSTIFKYPRAAPAPGGMLPPPEPLFSFLPCLLLLSCSKAGEDAANRITKAPLWCTAARKNTDHAHKAAPFCSGSFRLHGVPAQKGERSCFCYPICRIVPSSSTMIRVHCSAFTSWGC
mgnify:CR=1 FL=1